jgi:hypothetical protein
MSVRLERLRNYHFAYSEADRDGGNEAAQTAFSRLPREPHLETAEWSDLNGDHRLIHGDIGWEVSWDYRPPPHDSRRLERVEDFPFEWMMEMCVTGFVN